MVDTKLDEAIEETAEQSFNDSELQDIMSEIESLEKEFVEEGERTPEDLIIVSADKTDLQSAIDAEVASMSSEMVDDEDKFADEVIDEVEDDILAEMDDVASEEDMIAVDPESQVQAEVEVTEPETSTPIVAETTESEAVSPVVAEADNTVSEVDNVVELPRSEKVTSSTQGAAMDFSAAGTMDFNLNFNIGTEAATLKVDGDKGLCVEMGGVVIEITQEAGCTVTMEGGVNFNIPLTTSTNVAKKKVA